MSVSDLTIELHGNQISFQKNKVETNLVRVPFYSIALNWHEKIKREFFQIFSTLDKLYEEIDTYADQVRIESINQGMKVLASYGIYDFTEEQFYKNFMSKYDTWDEDFSIIADQYEAIVERTEELNAHRTARRQNRTKWVGYTAEGEGRAFAKNLSSNIGHGAFNLVAAGFTAIGNSIKKDEIFKNTDTLNQTAVSLYNIPIAAFNATIDAVNSELDGTFHNYTNEDSAKVEAIIDGIKKNRIPEESILPSLIRAIQLYPYNRDIYITLLSNFGDSSRKLDDLVNHFGIPSLSNEKKQIFDIERSKFNLSSLDDCKENLPILKDYANSIGYSDFENESISLLQSAAKKEFESKLKSIDISTISSCKENYRTLQNFADEIGYNGFDEDFIIIMSRAIDSDFKLKLNSMDLSTVSACKANIPILQVFADEIGHKNFNKQSAEILSRATESDFKLEVAKYNLDSTKNRESYLPKLELFAREIGYTKFDEWSAELQAKYSSRIAPVLIIYSTALIILSWLIDKNVSLFGFLICCLLFIIGLIFPKAAVFWTSHKTRSLSAKTYGSLIFLSFIIMLIFI